MTRSEAKIHESESNLSFLLRGVPIWEALEAKTLQTRRMRESLPGCAHIRPALLTQSPVSVRSSSMLLAGCVVVVISLSSSSSSWHSVVSQRNHDSMRRTVITGHSHSNPAAATHGDYASKALGGSKGQAAINHGARAVGPGHQGALLRQIPRQWRRARGQGGVRRRGDGTRCAQRLSDAWAWERLWEGWRGQGGGRDKVARGDGSCRGHSVFKEYSLFMNRTALLYSFIFMFDS